MQVYESEINAWLDRFGLYEYITYVDWGGSDDGAPACVGIDLETRRAIFYLDKDVVTTEKEFEDPKNIRREAFHQVCEMLLFEYGQRLITTGKEDEAARHAVIRRLENGIFSK